MPSRFVVYSAYTGVFASIQVERTRVKYAEAKRNILSRGNIGDQLADSVVPCKYITVTRVYNIKSSLRLSISYSVLVDATAHRGLAVEESHSYIDAYASTLFAASDSQAAPRLAFLARVISSSSSGSISA